MMMKKLLLTLFILLPFASHAVTSEKLSYIEYRSEVKKLSADCAANKIPNSYGLCLTEKLDQLTATAINVAIEVHKFERYLKRCTHTDFPKLGMAQIYAFKIPKVKIFYEEMASQTEALELYYKIRTECKSVVENDVAVLGRLKWFEWMATNFSGELKSTLPELGTWFVGRFSTEFPVENGTGNWSLKCVAGQDCILIMSQPDLLPKTISMRMPTQRETLIFNNNLARTREKLHAHPELYKDKREGPMLMSLRELLSSDAKFEQCVDIGVDIEVVLCSLTTDSQALNSLVLLLGTMKANCGNSPFCAYYYQLSREKSELNDKPHGLQAPLSH